MNYKKIYDQLVEKEKPRGLDRSSVDYYTEIHHIVPRCMGGSNEDDNLVMFSAREHLIAHVLLWKAFPKHVGIVNAASMMVAIQTSERINSRVAAKLREESSIKRSLRTEGAGYGATRHIDIAGEKYGRLTVQNQYVWHYFPSGQRKAKWLCVCECGNTCEVLVCALRSGMTSSCGCYMREQTSKANRKWDCSRKTYEAYANMLARCYSPLHKSNSNFVKYGISVCDEWLGESGVSNFVRDMGEKPENLQLIRLDPFKDFCKENCLWVTKAEASKSVYKFPRNKRNLTGKTGVKFDKRRNKFVAKINLSGKELTKQFNTFEEAANQRDAWEAEYKIIAEA